MVALLLGACGKPAAAPETIDVWTTRPQEPFSNKLEEDRLDNPATVEFTIQLPQGMFHDPRSEPEKTHFYGVWTANGFLDGDAPFVAVRLAPYGPKTLDELANDVTRNAELFAKQTLDDGTLSVTTHVGTHRWEIVQLRFPRAGLAVRCSASRHDDTHALGAPTRNMLEQICGSLVIR